MPLGPVGVFQRVVVVTMLVPEAAALLAQSLKVSVNCWLVPSA